MMKVYLIFLLLQAAQSYYNYGQLVRNSFRSKVKRDLLKAESILDIAGSNVISYVGKAKRSNNVESNTFYWRPYVTLSYAQTIDGTIAPIQKGRMNISSPQSFSLKHSLRSLHDGILIGVNTLSIDAPRLDVRVPLKPTSGSTPRPIVLDSHLKILSVSNMLLHSPIVFTLLDAKSPAFVQAQQSINGTIVTCKQDAEGRCCLKDCLYQLYHQFSICSLLVEGGANIIQSFLDTNLVDQVVVFVKPSFAGGYRSLVSELSSLQNVAELQVGESGGDLVLQGRIA